MSEPYEQPHPEGVYESFTFSFRFHKDTGNYTLYCPEWRCEIACGKYPGHSAYGLLMEIAGHNSAELIAQAEELKCGSTSTT